MRNKGAQKKPFACSTLELLGFSGNREQAEQAEQANRDFFFKMSDQEHQLGRKKSSADHGRNTVGNMKNPAFVIA